MPDQAADRGLRRPGPTKAPIAPLVGPTLADAGRRWPTLAGAPLQFVSLVPIPVIEPSQTPAGSTVLLQQIARTSRSWTLLRRFGIISLVLVTALGLALSVALQSTLRDRTLADARRAAVIAATTGIQPLLTPADLLRNFVPLDADRVVQLDAAIRPAITDDGIVRIKIWNRQHWIV